ncbi:MAG: HAMP domain-containing histidine kinase [Prevotella sp.]|nr:HAMP domain-containing histidine kinase [Prevotella sp.]
MITLFILLGVTAGGAVWWFVLHQRRLRLRAYLMQEAVRNHDFTFRLPTRGLLFGERAMQETLNQLGNIIRQQTNRSEVESWERLTRVLTHEMMNATAPIASISQSLLQRPDVKGTPIEEGIQAINNTSRHLTDFVAGYRKMSQLEHPVIVTANLLAIIDDVRRVYPDVTWQTDVPAEIYVSVDIAMMRQVLINLVKNAVEAGAKTIVIAADSPKGHPQYLQKGGEGKPEGVSTLYIGNDGQPIPAENRQSLFVPFFTTKRTGSGIGLSLSRRMMVQQGGMLDLAEKQLPGCHAGFLLMFGGGF